MGKTLGKKNTARQLARVGILVTSLPTTCKLAVFVGLASALAATVLVAHAQVPRGDQPIPEPRQSETVTSRPRSDFDPRGTRIAGFLVFPKLEATAMRDSNIFSDDTNEIDDSIAIASPSVRVKSNFNNHALNLDASGEIGRYASEDSEDYEDFTVGADGRLDIRRTSNIYGRLRFRQEHEDRGSPDDVNGLEPTEFDVGSANIGYFQRFNRLSVRLEGIFDQLDFDDTPAALTIINNDDRDRDENRASLRLAYEIIPDYEAIFRARHTQIDYDSSLDDDGFNRDSDGDEFLVGAAIDLTGVITGEFSIGNVTQDFDDPQLENIDDSIFKLGVTWNVTRLTTFEASADRGVRQTTVVGASGILQSSGSIGVDHELRRNILLHGDIKGTKQEFTGIARTDHLYNASVSVRYLINPNFFASFEYTFRERDSDVESEDFTKNRVIFGVGGQI